MDTRNKKFILIWIVIILLYVGLAVYYVSFRKDLSRYRTLTKQQATDQLFINRLQQNLLQLQSAAESSSNLKSQQQAIPLSGKESDIIRAVQGLISDTGMQIEVMRMAASPATAGKQASTKSVLTSAVSSKTLNLTVSGTQQDFIFFLRRIYAYPRIFYVQQFTMDHSGSTYNLLLQTFYSSK